jgi:hypothetical protein
VLTKAIVSAVPIVVSGGSRRVAPMTIARARDSHPTIEVPFGREIGATPSPSS